MKPGAPWRIPPFPWRCNLRLYLFLRRKDKLASFHADHDAGLLREVQGILTTIDRTEANNAFRH
jgi:hypothetical protein